MVRNTGIVRGTVQRAMFDVTLFVVLLNEGTLTVPRHRLTPCACVSDAHLEHELPMHAAR